jgi:2-methylcitrate dehydratase PrpD
VHELAELLAGITTSTLPRSVVEAAERVVTHVLGFGILGANLDMSSAARQLAEQEPGRCTVIATPNTSAPAAAAFANATACHEDFRDDADSTSQSHPTVVVVPAALALAEHVPASPGAQHLLEAIVQGVEVTVRLGAIGATSSTPRGFRASALYPVFGAAAAAARMLDLSVSQTAVSLGLAAQSVGGLNQAFDDGTDDWFLAPGLAARAGVTAALLAAAGAVSSPRVLEGPAGFFAAYGDVQDVVLDTSPPTEAETFAIEALRLKPLLSCGWNQSLLHLLSRLAVDPADVESVEVRLSEAAVHFPGVAVTGPFDTRTAALLSAPFAAATFILRGRLAPRDYAIPVPDDVLALARRVDVAVEEGFQGYDTALVVRLRDGSRHEASYLNDDDPHSLTTQGAVLENLATAFSDAGADPCRVPRLALGVREMLGNDDVQTLVAELRSSAT